MVVLKVIILFLIPLVSFCQIQFNFVNSKDSSVLYNQGFIIYDQDVKILTVIYPSSIKKYIILKDSIINNNKVFIYGYNKKHWHNAFVIKEYGIILHGYFKKNKYVVEQFINLKKI